MFATTLGTELRRLREQSVYRCQSAFSERCAVGRRSLQYIEQSRVVPKTETLERILAAVGATPATAQRLRRLRDRAQAERDGFSLAQRDELQIPRLTSRVVAETTRYLRRYHRLTDHEVDVLYGRVAKVISSVLEGDTP